MKKLTRRKFVKTAGMAGGIIGAGVSPLSAFEIDRQPESFDGLTSPREILVQSVSHPNFTENGNYEDDIKVVLETMERTSSYKPDIICLPEVFANSAKDPQTVPGAITNTFSDYAKKHHCYIICTLNTLRKNNIYNTAVLIDREGKITGMYDKIYPTEGEITSGVTPAESAVPPVFDTDFGRIGILICFDINWTKLWEGLRAQGAEIVFWPSAYPNPHLLTSHARQYGYYVVGNSRINPSYIFDGTGDLISMSGRYEPWAFARLNLEKIFCEIDFHVDKIKDIREKYGRKVNINYYHDSDWATIESKSPDLTIKQLVDEYGLTSRWHYMKRAGAFADKNR